MAKFKVEDDPQKRDWSNLPIDIIGKVMEKLFFWLDQRHLALVCKNWSLCQRLFPFSLLFPSILTFKTVQFDGSYNGYTQYELYDPLRKKTYLVGEIKRPENEIVFYVLIGRPKFGWLLLKNILSHPYPIWTLFSPFTGELITLSWLHRNGLATFFMNSTSPECVVFMFTRPSDDCMCCSMYRLGDATWKTLKLDPPSHVRQFNCYPLDVTYLDGSFYCLFRGGELCEINLNLQEWRWLEQRSPKLEINCANKYYRLVDSSTDLLLYETDNGCKKDMLDEWVTNEPRILRYDFSDKLWIHENKLGNRQILRDKGCCWGAREWTMDKIPLVIKDSKGYENIHYAPDWLPKENRNRGYEVQISWFDQRFVWRKKDILKLSQ